MLFKKETLLSGTWHRINIFEFFSPTYWKANFFMVYSYIQDNFTLWYYGLFIIGLIFVSLKAERRFRTFIFFYLLAIVPYGMFLSDFFRQHSYYQMPFLPLVCITCAFALVSLKSFLEKDTSLRWAKYAPLIFLIVTFPALKSSINRQYDTIFYGLDVGADYLKSHMPAGSRFFALGHPQSVAVCALSRRLCGFGHPRSLEEFKFGEEKRNMGWLFAYGDYGMQELFGKKEMFAYLQDNYRLVQIGFLGTEQQLRPAYYIFKKGGKFNFDELKNIKNQPKLAKQYDTTRGSIPFYTLDLK